jgi:hypothetical protein
MDLGGRWRLRDSLGIAHCVLAVRQTGGRVSGAAYFEAGTALVEGRVGDVKASLDITFHHAKVLGQWLAPAQAAQVAGIHSRLDIVLEPGADSLSGVYQGFYVTFDRQGRVLQVMAADHPGVVRVHPPRLVLLEREPEAR